MKSGILLLVFALLLAFTVNTQSNNQITINYIVEHEVESDKDYLEVVVEAKAQDTSLKNSLADAAQTVAFIRNQVEKFCLQFAKKKSDCEQVSEQGKFSVQPQYRTIRGEPVFIAFLVKYEVTTKILHHDKDIGPLVDRIGKRSGSMILSVEWKDANEQDEQMKAIDAGLEQAQKRCDNIGGKLSEIVSVSEEPRFELEEKPEEGEEEADEEQQQPEVIRYNFEVRCLLSASKKK